MPIFETPTDNTPAADLLAQGFIAEANQAFENQVEAAYDAIQRFWYRNRDADGNPSTAASESDPVPTGPEILEAMGTNAQAVMLVAYARVQMLLSIESALGLSIVEPARVAAPFDLTFNPDGSLASATLKP